jgi:hypothetical protein
MLRDEAHNLRSPPGRSSARLALPGRRQGEFLASSEDDIAETQNGDSSARDQLEKVARYSLPKQHLRFKICAASDTLNTIGIRVQ